MKAISTKAISHFIDHTYPVIEEAIKPSRGHSTNVMNKEFSFNFRPIFINTLDKSKSGSSFPVSELR